MRCRHPPEPMAAGIQSLVGRQAARRPDREVLDVDCRSDLAARPLRVRRDREPVVQRAAFVDLEMTPANPPQRGRVDDPGDGIANLGKHLSHAGVKQQRFLVTDEKVVELQIELRDVDGDAKQVLGDFVDLCHGWPPFCAFQQGSAASVVRVTGGTEEMAGTARSHGANWGTTEGTGINTGETGVTEVTGSVLQVAVELFRKTPVISVSPVNSVL